MTKIYDFQEYLQRKQTKDSLEHGSSQDQDLWNMIKEKGYDINDPDDIEQFFRDLKVV
jgi:predicted metalloprotease|tara:strand:+ start:630 stop:803 length:174 start_codon:yes stop_codon:yes gene_type:complete